MADTNTSSSLFTFIDEETDTIIALTGEANQLEKIAGGKGATISVDCTVLLWGTAYTVSDILINMTNQPNRFLPEEYDGMALGEAFDYTISVRLMVHEQ
ncbi:MAG: hypothetical protein WC716_14355 [Chitinophagaceae bacterium]|jgi:hypothetical protein